MIFGNYASPLGTILLASDGQALTGLWFEGQENFARGVDEAELTAAYRRGVPDARTEPAFAPAVQWLDAYFAGKAPSVELLLAPVGTDFQQRVWAVLRGIPFGQTMTYGQIAAKLKEDDGGGVSAQAVGGALARNPLVLVVPCHRVLGADGRLTGFAAGVERKQQLLTLEGIAL